MMKFTVERETIKDVLSKVQGLTGRKSNLAITTNVLIQAQNETISMVATDLETGFEGQYAAQVESGGTIAINAKKLFEIVRDFPSESILFNETENHWIKIGNQKVEYHLVGMDPDDFPEIPQIEEIKFVEVAARALRGTIEKMAMVGGATDDKRAHIIGAYLEWIAEENQGFLRMVSTDGSRLSKDDLTTEDDPGFPEDSGFLIPKRGLSDVGKFLDVEGNVRIGLKDNHFIVKKENENIIVRLLEGDFPKYGDIIRSREGHTILLNRQQFLMMLKRMSIMASENYRGVIFSFKPEMLLINSTNPDIGESKEEMAIEFDGESIEAAFNPRFFIDALSAMGGENAVLHLCDEESPCLLHGDDESRFLSAIMPMRI